MNESNLQLFFENHVFDTSSTGKANVNANEEDEKMPAQHQVQVDVVDHEDRTGIACNFLVHDARVLLQCH